MIDPFRLCLGLGPIAVYLLLLGAINVFRRPFLVSGVRDTAALGLAVSGLIFVGPMELFVPVAAMIAFGPYIWVFLISLFALGLVLVLLVSRPRLIIYNIAVDQLRPILADLAAELDSDARWAGDGLVLPNLGVRAHLEIAPLMRNASLVSSGAEQNFQGWYRLELALRGELSRLEVARNPRGVSLIGSGVLLGLAVLTIIARDPHAVFQSLAAMIQMSL